MYRINKQTRRTTRTTIVFKIISTLGAGEIKLVSKMLAFQAWGPQLRFPALCKNTCNL